MTGVLFLTESYHPVLGGGEQHIRTLAARLAARGLACTVVTRQGEPEWPAEEDDGGVRVVRVPPPGAGRGGKYRMVGAALAAVRRERARFDVLVVRGTRVLGLPGVMAARALDRRVVLQPELNGEMTGEIYTWGTRFDRGAVHAAVGAGVRARNLLLRDADAFVAMSRRIAAEFVECGVEPAKVSLIPHGVDTTRFRPPTRADRARLRAERGFASDDAIVLAYTGRLLRGKGLETLLAAFAPVAAEHPTVLLALVGSGAGQSLSIEDALRADVAARGLSSRVLFPGRVDDVEHWLQASDVFVFPSVFEALGLSLVEAAACGLPCIGAETGGIVDVVEEGRTGRRFPPGDERALAGAIRDLVADRTARERYGATARRVALARFDLEESVTRYEALFTELAAGRSQPLAAPVNPTPAVPPPPGAPRAGGAPPR